jgi:hypothetical protein
VDPRTATGGELVRDAVAGAELRQPQIGVLVNRNGTRAPRLACDEVEYAGGRLGK